MGQAPGVKGQHVCLICSMVARQARSLLDNNASKTTTTTTQGNVVVHKKKSSSNASKCQIVSSLTVKAKIHPATLESQQLEVSDERKIVSSFTLSPDGKAAELFPAPATTSKASTVGDWDMPPPAPRNPRKNRSAPSSPRTDQPLQNSLFAGKSKNGIPLFRKRSESLGDEILSGRRTVSFAPRPEILESQQESESLVAVEFEASDPAMDDVDNTTRRVRSASCHVLSGQTATDTCGTIYEEVGPASSSMDE